MRTLDPTFQNTIAQTIMIKTQDFIRLIENRIKLISWLSKYGCTIQCLNFFPTITIRTIDSFNAPLELIARIPYSFKLGIYQITFCYYVICSCGLYSAFKNSDWQKAKKISSEIYKTSTFETIFDILNHELDDIPF